jgi:molybdate transport system substrate-binding protein
MKLLFILVVHILFISCSSKQDRKLSLAVSANMQFAIEEIVAAFEEETQIPCEIVSSSSGKLSTQILQGAPFDLFISADMEYPLHIYQGGKAKNKPEVYALGKLILWSSSEKEKIHFDFLKQTECTHIALANPETAPYGQAALQVLKKLHLYEPNKSKFVFGESIAQTNQFIQSKSAQVGFTSLSVVKSPQMIAEKNWIEIPDSLYEPILQGIVQLKSQNETEATRFYKFMFSERVKMILAKYGYGVV